VLGFLLLPVSLELSDDDRHRDGGQAARPQVTQDHLDAATLGEVVLNVADFQIIVLEEVAAVVGIEVVVGNIPGVSHFIVLDLVNVNSRRKLVRLTESYHWHAMLLSEVGKHRGACFSNYTSISEYIGGSDEALGGAGDECANA